MTRDRAKEDRRVVTHRLTKAGLELVNELDRPIEALHRKAMRHMKPERLAGTGRAARGSIGPACQDSC